MPPRLAHRKSRAGCRRCKERKVKCDEDRPSCRACLRHGVHCEYGDPLAPSKPESAENVSPPEGSELPKLLSVRSSSSGPPSGPDSPYPSSAGELAIPEDKRNSIELYLLHRFKSSVAASFPSSQTPLLKEVYVWSAVEIGLDHPFLLHAIFSVTALYLHVLSSPNPPESEPITRLPDAVADANWGQLHRIYLNMAIQRQREALRHLDSNNADAVALTSIMLTIMATCLLSASSSRGDEAASESVWSNQIQWLTLAGATSAIFRASLATVNEGPIMAYLRVSSSPDFSDNKVLFNPDNAIPFNSIIEFREPANNKYEEQIETDPVNREAYRSALAFIGGTWSAVIANESRHFLCMRVVSFGSLVPKALMHLLQLGRPRALVIIAQFMALVKHIDDYWWFKGRAEKEIQTIHEVVPREWRWALRWPLAVLSDPRKAKLDPREYNAPVNQRVYQDLSIEDFSPQTNVVGRRQSFSDSKD